MMRTPRKLPIHRSLNRPTLMVGGDREMVLTTALISGVLVFSVGTWWGVVLGVTFWLLSIAILRRLALADPIMRKVFVRLQRYQKYYPAAARWCGRRRIMQSNWRG